MQKRNGPKKWFSRLSQEAKVKVQIFCHGLITRTAVTVCPLHAKIKTAQQKALARSKQPLVQVTVCRACGTFRNKGLMSGTSRSSIGIQINLPVVDSSSFTCNGCGHSWGLCRVNLVGNALLTRPKLDAEKKWIYLCTGCGSPSESCTFDGVLPVCTKCIKKKRTLSSACFACSAIKSRMQMKTFEADNQGTPKTFYACECHFPNMAGIENVPIALIKRQVLAIQKQWPSSSRYGAATHYSINV